MHDFAELEALIIEMGADLPSDRTPVMTDDERVTRDILDTMDELTMGLVK